MNAEQIEKWAREAGFAPSEFGLPPRLIGDLTRFADLVAAAERERCAQLCDDMVLYTGFDCAAAIRNTASRSGG